MFYKKSGFLHNAKHRHGPFSLTMLCNIDKFRGGFFFFSWNGIYFRCQFFNLLHIAHFAKHSALWDHWLWIGLYLILKRFFFFLKINCMHVQIMSRSDCLLYLAIFFLVYKSTDQRILCIFLHNFVSDLSWIATGRYSNNCTQIIESIQH